MYTFPSPSTLLRLLCVLAKVISRPLGEPLKKEVWSGWFMCVIKFITLVRISFNRFFLVYVMVSDLWIALDCSKGR